jgi:hypothetical protein
MAKPIGLQSKLKDNSKKLYRNNEEWMKGKKIGRPKQVWVDDIPVNDCAKPSGYWKKVTP